MLYKGSSPFFTLADLLSSFFHRRKTSAICISKTRMSSSTRKQKRKFVMTMTPRVVLGSLKILKPADSTRKKTISPAWVIIVKLSLVGDLKKLIANFAKKFTVQRGRGLDRTRGTFEGRLDELDLNCSSKESRSFKVYTVTGSRMQLNFGKFDCDL